VLCFRTGSRECRHKKSDVCCLKSPVVDEESMKPVSDLPWLESVVWVSFSALKMICNDFLVVKVNCWSYVFNIIQPIWILRNIKDKKIAEKKHLNVRCSFSRESGGGWRKYEVWWLVYFSQVMTSYQENTTKQPVECWVLTTDRAKTNRHNDKRRNRLLKHKRIK